MECLGCDKTILFDVSIILSSESDSSLFILNLSSFNSDSELDSSFNFPLISATIPLDEKDPMDCLSILKLIFLSVCLKMGLFNFSFKLELMKFELLCFLIADLFFRLSLVLY